MFTTLWGIITAKPVKIASTIFVALLGIYGTFIYEKKPTVVLEVVSNASVLDVREKLSNLVITYAGTNLKDQNQNLYLVSVRVSNNGNADIVKNDFDEFEPLGMKFTSGTILEKPTLVADSYLFNNLKPTVHGPQSVLFSPVILNSGDSFQVKTLLSVPIGQIPKVIALGKIAGVKKIEVTEAYKEASNKSFWDEAFNGNYKVQLIRAIGYFFGTFISIIICGAFVIAPSIFITEYVSKTKRTKTVKNYRKAANRALNLREEYFINKFVNDDMQFYYLKSLLFPDEENKYRSSSFKSIHLGGQAHIDHETGTIRNEYFIEDDEVVNELVNAGLILRDGLQVTVNPDIETQLKDFMIYISELN